MKKFLQLTRLMIFVPVLFLAVFAPISKTLASDEQGPTTFTTTGPNDYYFELTAGTTFTLRTYAQQYGIDSQLWLYDSNDTVLAVNDDYFGLDSYISYNVQADGTYRLRTSICCGNPDRWTGTSYVVESGSAPTNAPPTTTTTSTTTSTTSTTTTTIAPYLNSPQNLVVTLSNESKVYLSWDAPEQSNTQVERYAVFFSNDNWDSGWAISSTETSVIVENLESGTIYQFRVRADNDSVSVYSGWSNEVERTTTATTTTSSTTTTSTTTSTTTTTSTIVETTTTTEAPLWTTTTVLTPPATVTTTEPIDETPPSTSYPESDEPVASVPQHAPEQETTADEAPIEVPTEVQATADEEVAAIFDNPITEAELENAVGELLTDAESPEELTAVVNSLLEQDLTDEQFSTVIDTVFSEPLSDENFAAAIDAVFAEPLSDEKFDAVINAVLDQPLSDEQFEELVGVLESETVSEEQVAAAVDSIIELGVTEDQATELATSAKVLESIDGDQATEIFDAVDISAVTPEEAAALVEAVQEAPTEVREAMESEINVFQGVIDTYVPLGSSVPIKTRRAIIGASALAIFSAPVPVSRRK